MEKKNEKDRMQELVAMFSKKDEIYTSKEKNNNTSDVLKKEYSRLKDLGSGKLNADFKESYFASNEFGIGGQGMTVNGIIDNMYANPSVSFKPIKQPIKTEEALDIAIKRTIESGAPVNNLDFYAEVNWQLAQLGFPSRNPLDIKTKLISLIVKDKE